MQRVLRDPVEKRNRYTLEVVKGVLEDIYLRNVRTSDAAMKWEVPYWTIQGWRKEVNKVGVDDYLLRFHSRAELMGIIRAQRKQLTGLMADKLRTLDKQT